MKSLRKYVAFFTLNPLRILKPKFTSSTYEKSDPYRVIIFFFSFRIESERSQIAYVTFKDSQGADTALMLSVSSSFKHCDITRFYDFFCFSTSESDSFLVYELRLLLNAGSNDSRSFDLYNTL